MIVECTNTVALISDEHSVSEDIGWIVGLREVTEVESMMV